MSRTQFVIVRTYPKTHREKPGVVEDAGVVSMNMPAHLVEFVARKCSADPGCCGYHIEERRMAGGKTCTIGKAK